MDLHPFHVIFQTLYPLSVDEESVLQKGEVTSQRPLGPGSIPNHLYPAAGFTMCVPLHCQPQSERCLPSGSAAGWEGGRGGGRCH